MLVQNGIASKLFKAAKGAAPAAAAAALLAAGPALAQGAASGVFDGVDQMGKDAADGLGMISKTVLMLAIMAAGLYLLITRRINGAIFGGIAMGAIVIVFAGDIADWVFSFAR